MKVLLAGLLCLSILTLVKDVYKGFNENEVDIYFDIFLILTTLIPFLFNFFLFVKKDTLHRKYIIHHVKKFFMFDLGIYWEIKNCEKGESIFCNQAHIYPVPSETSLIMYFVKIKQNSIFLLSEGCKWLKMDLTFEEGVEIVKDMSWIDKKLKYGYSRIFSVDFDGDIVKIKYGDISDFNKFGNNESNFKWIELRNGQVDFFQKLEWLCWQQIQLKGLNLTIGELKVSLKNDTLKVTHLSNFFDDGFAYSLNGLNIEDKFTLSICLYFWSLKSRIGIFCENSFEKFFCADENTNNRYHCLNFSEIISCIKDGYRPMLYDKGFMLKCLIGDKDSVMTLNRGDGNLDLKKFGNSLSIDPGSTSSFGNVFEKLEYFEVGMDLLKPRYGFTLSEFILNYTLDFFGHFNFKAINFVSKRSSCWRYKDISSNWKSKRFLCDFNFILEVAGLPRFTHIDKKMKPTTKIINLRNSIPLAVLSEKRKILVYDLNKINKEELNLGKRELKNARSCASAHKRNQNSNINKLALNYKNLERNFMINVEKTNDVAWPVLKSCNDVETIKVKDFHLNYKMALLKACDKNKGAAIKKLGDLFLQKKKIASLPKLKEKIEFTKDVVSGKKKYKGFKRKIVEPKENNVKLENYFKILESYVADVEDVKDSLEMVFTEEDICSIFMTLKKDLHLDLSDRRILRVIKSFFIKDYKQKKCLVDFCFKRLLNLNFVEINEELISDRIIKETTKINNQSLEISKVYRSRTKLQGGSMFLSKRMMKIANKSKIKRERKLKQSGNPVTILQVKRLSTTKLKLPENKKRKHNDKHNELEFQRKCFRVRIKQLSKQREEMIAIKNKLAEEELKKKEKKEEEKRKLIEIENINKANSRKQKELKKMKEKEAEKNKIYKSMVAAEVKKLISIHGNVSLLPFTALKGRCSEYFSNGYYSIKKVCEYENEEERLSDCERTKLEIVNYDPDLNGCFIHFNFFFYDKYNFISPQNLKVKSGLEILMKKNINLGSVIITQD